MITDRETPEVQPSQPFAEKTKDFGTRFGTQPADRSGAEDAANERRPSWSNRAPPVATTPKLADLAALCGGRGQLLKVAEVADQLGVCAAIVYRLCERGALLHVRIGNSIRIRPDDLKEFITAQERQVT